ncbi:MAG TPA: ATP-binding protein, partial [Polyangia bacterium]|nr:ATP-binding protein [Polyangia bacterium]
GYVLAHDETLLREFERASADVEAILGRLRQRVTSQEGIALLDSSTRTLRAHDRALREVMAMPGSLATTALVWATEVRPKASLARSEMDAFIRHKQQLHDEARERVSRAQRRAAWVMAVTALSALLLAVFGGGWLLRSAGRAYAVEQHARTAAEQERLFFFNLLDQLPIGIVAAAPSNEIIHVSGFARKMLEKDNVPWATAKVVDDYDESPAFRPDGSPYPVEELPLSRALRGELVAQEEIRSASDHVYSVTAGPIRDESGSIIAAVVGFLDISERKLAEKERALFIGALGHDLRNPVQAIALAADSLARRNDVPDVARKPAARIASSALRMNQLISDLLDFARSQHGAIPLRPESCQLREIASEVIAEIKLARPDREIRVEAEGGCDGSWDRARMTQVFQNLLVNAVEHGDPQTPITVRTGCGADVVWAEVTNRGAIPPDERPRIFEPFRARATSKGLGLGLYIARALVEAHGGTIAVDCKQDETIFRIELPARARTKAHVRQDRPSA